MARKINDLKIEGKVVSEVQLRKSKTDISVVDFRLMHKNLRARNPVFVDIEVWGREAERTAEFIKRGYIILVYGELRQDVWEKNGEPRSKLKITAQKVMLLTDIKQSSFNEEEIGSF